MKYLGLIVFSLHALFELTFGVRAFWSGAFGGLPEMADGMPQLSVSARFLGSALIALGALSAVTVFTISMSSLAARVIAFGFALFHTLGCIGLALTASEAPELWADTYTIGAISIHGTLAIGFLVFLAGQLLSKKHPV